MDAVIDPMSHTISNELIQYLIEESTDAKWNHKSDLITYQKCSSYLEDFLNQREDSKQYLDAVDFFGTYFDDQNHKEIDL